MARRSKTAGITTDSAGNKTIDKVCLKERVFARLGPVSQQQAEEYLAARIEAIRRRNLYGERPQKTFREAAIRYLRENWTNASIDDDAWHVDLIDPWIGKASLQQIHDGTLEPFKTHRLQVDQVSPTTIKRTLEVVRKILNAAARSYRDDGHTWLATAPLLTMPSLSPRKPYALSWDEQRELFGRLPPHLARMALFAVNTGCRDQEVCRLQWKWEQRLPELGTSVFVIPADFGGRRSNSGVKNGEDRIVVLNRVARSVIEECRGQHPEFVFVYQRRNGKRYEPVLRINNTAWQRAREVCQLPVRVHDLKHTFGRRLRAAGVGLETRRVLLGHKNDDITVHYSPAELKELLEAVERLAESPPTTLLKVVRGA